MSPFCHQNHIFEEVDRMETQFKQTSSLAEDEEDQRRLLPSHARLWKMELQTWTAWVCWRLSAAKQPTSLVGTLFTWILT